MKDEDKPGVARMSMDYFFMSQEEENAQDNPMSVMVDEHTGDRYARMTGAKGIGENQERDWLIKDMSEELKDWGHTGGEGGHTSKCPLGAIGSLGRTQFSKYKDDLRGLGRLTIASFIPSCRPPHFPHRNSYHFPPQVPSPHPIPNSLPTISR